MTDMAVVEIDSEGDSGEISEKSKKSCLLGACIPNHEQNDGRNVGIKGASHDMETGMIFLEIGARKSLP